jgi:hypothetical protein
MSTLKERMKATLDKRFEGKATDVFRQRIHKIVDAMPDDPEQMDGGLNNVRIAIKLLFDDDLSREMHEELSLMAKYSDRL